MNPPKMTNPRRLLWLLGLLILPFVSCSQSSSSDINYDAMFHDAEQLILEAKWREAHFLLRIFLKENPSHPGAHFYLGRSYLFLADDFRPTIAEGELQTALALYRENGNNSFIDRFDSPNYFEIICNMESTKVAMKEYAFLLEFNAHPTIMQDSLQRARFYVEEARKVAPNNKDVLDYDSYVRSLEEPTFSKATLRNMAWTWLLHTYKVAA